MFIVRVASPLTPHIGCARGYVVVYSAVFYSKKHGELLDPLISAMVDELREHDIHIYTVVIEVATDVLWSRIQQRLAREPERIKVPFQLFAAFVLFLFRVL